MGAPDSLGVSQLLDELLALDTDAGAAGTVQGPAGGGGSGDVGVQQPALGSAAADAGDSRACPRSGELAGPAQASQLEEDMAQQVAELCDEVDACLQSLDGWEQESRQHQERLKRDLEKQYGFSYDGQPVPSAGQAAEAAEDSDDSSCPEVECLEPGLRRDGVGLPGAAIPFPREDTSWAKHGRDSVPVSQALLGPAAREYEAQRLADERRIASLRAEVEALKCQQQRPAPVAELEEDDAMTGTGAPSYVLNSSAASPSGLSDWCAEVDAVLRAAPGNAHEGPGNEGLGEVEKSLAQAFEQAELMQGALASASSCLEAELGDLDQLLSECSVLHAQMARDAAADAQPP